MKYPIDPVTTETFFGHLIAHDRAQRQMILALTILVQEAMTMPDADEEAWYDEAKKLLKIQKQTAADHETRIFNAKNGHPDKSSIEVSVVATTGKVDSQNETIHVPGVVIDPEMNVKLNEHEAKVFGEEMSEEEIARMFREKPKKKQKGEVNLNDKEPFKGMTLDEIEAWEAKQQNSNDIYKIKGRVQNLAVGISGGNLTAVGEMMVNSFVHVVKDLYDFAETIPDKSLKIALSERIRKHESMPGNLISAASAGVKGKKS